MFCAFMCDKNYMACMNSNCLVLNRIFCLHTLALALAFLFVSNFPSLAHGRKFPEFSATTHMRNQENAIKMRSVIGSRPPRCEERCKSCGHSCEAIQVPISPAINKFLEKSRNHLYAIVEFSSRGDDISNYKPMCWKCKCGDFIFNP